MADNSSKIKLFVFCCGISLLFNITAMICSLLLGNNLDIVSFVNLAWTSFIPFADVVNLAFLGLDLVTGAFIGVFVSLLGAIKLAVIVSWLSDFVPFVG